VSILCVERLSASPWQGLKLADIDFRLESGQILALGGPNGAGKSSLLRLIAGDFPGQDGAIRFRNLALADWRVEERARHLAYLPQLSLLNFPYTVEEVILLGRTPHASGRQHDLTILDAVMAMTDLDRLRGCLYTQMSGGERQRTQLARVFAQLWDDSLEGKLLLLDEPTSALDLAHQQQVLSAVQELARRGCAIILTIHDFNLAASVADRLMILDDGRQVALGSPSDILSAELFESVFHAAVTLGRHPATGDPVVLPAGLD
jgi:iron complex transport system ATP-binding protein